MTTSDPQGLVDAEHDFNAWSFWAEAGEEEQARQRERLDALAQAGAVLGERCVVSTWAACFPDRLVLGAGSYLAAFSYVTGDVEIGEHSTLNAYSVVRGRVRIGDGVRIGAHTSVLGFDHSIAPELPVRKQPLTSAGITIGDDVYIGSHVAVVDGVAIGAHSVIGAGAVVTRDVPEWSVMVGNPARRIRDRRGTSAPARGQDATGALQRLAESARRDGAAVLERCWDPEQQAFVDTPGAPATVRALCDAIEIAALMGDGELPGLSRADAARDLLSRQDEATGLIPERASAGEAAEGESVDAVALGGGRMRYHVLSAGYALDLLGERFAHPVRVVDELDAEAMLAAVAAQPWGERAWGAGDWVDVVGTALTWNREWFGLDGAVEALLGWLHLAVDRRSGTWGAPQGSDGLRQPVNGYYRLTRGTFAQWGLPVPHPERTIDTVLAHAQDQRFFGTGRSTACDVLDIAHPLWLAGQQTAHRADEVREWAQRQAIDLERAWKPGRGFGFAQRPDDVGQAAPGLQGTEMWLAISWYLADLLGAAGSLGLEPRGVHRPWPRLTITR
ncbi:acetyltransferase [Brachybacterium ginsengisoli]|uniref:Acetyltransferase n=1 Tax=Brachybacterium ginsengisoli TaxID=1331682 RepID=A0A291GTX2_9MICO|nr:acyltransferase [Brachybacterium ginsengisoli]ATG53659.1 acetyltransferase [Brachybacterium ginsengisoli]